MRRISLRSVRRCTRLLCLVGGVLMLGGCAPLSDDGAGQPLQRRTIAVGDNTFNVELAVTAEQIERGLMFREELGQDEGMLFVFGAEQPLQFWMLNTLIPLDIAFLDNGGTILNIETMEPRSLMLHHSDGPARYALEVNAGEFARRGIAPGDVVVEIE